GSLDPPFGSCLCRWYSSVSVAESDASDKSETLVIPYKSARDPSPSFLRASAHALRMTGWGLQNSGGGMGECPGRSFAALRMTGWGRRMTACGLTIAVAGYN